MSSYPHSDTPANHQVAISTTRLTWQMPMQQSGLITANNVRAEGGNYIKPAYPNLISGGLVTKQNNAAVQGVTRLGGGVLRYNPIPAATLTSSSSKDTYSSAQTSNTNSSSDATASQVTSIGYANQDVAAPGVTTVLPMNSSTTVIGGYGFTNPPLQNNRGLHQLNPPVIRQVSYATMRSASPVSSKETIINQSNLLQYQQGPVLVNPILQNHPSQQQQQTSNSSGGILGQTATRTVTRPSVQRIPSNSQPQQQILVKSTQQPQQHQRIISSAQQEIDNGSAHASNSAVLSSSEDQSSSTEQDIEEDSITLEEALLRQQKSAAASMSNSRRSDLNVNSSSTYSVQERESSKDTSSNSGFVENNSSYNRGNHQEITRGTVDESSSSMSSCPRIAEEEEVLSESDHQPSFTNQRVDEDGRTPSESSSSCTVAAENDDDNKTYRSSTTTTLNLLRDSTEESLNLFSELQSRCSKMTRGMGLLAHERYLSGNLGNGSLDPNEVEEEEVSNRRINSQEKKSSDSKEGSGTTTNSNENHTSKYVEAIHQTYNQSNNVEVGNNDFTSKANHKTDKNNNITTVSSAVSSSYATFIGENDNNDIDDDDVMPATLILSSNVFSSMTQEHNENMILDETNYNEMMLKENDNNDRVGGRSGKLDNNAFCSNLFEGSLNGSKISSSSNSSSLKTNTSTTTSLILNKRAAASPKVVPRNQVSRRTSKNPFSTNLNNTKTNQVEVLTSTSSIRSNGHAKVETTISASSTISDSQIYKSSLSEILQEQEESTNSVAKRALAAKKTFQTNQQSNTNNKKNSTSSYLSRNNTYAPPARGNKSPIPTRGNKSPIPSTSNNKFGGIINSDNVHAQTNLLSRRFSNRQKSPVRVTNAFNNGVMNKSPTNFGQVDQKFLRSPSLERVLCDVERPMTNFGKDSQTISKKPQNNAINNTKINMKKSPIKKAEEPAPAIARRRSSILSNVSSRGSSVGVFGKNRKVEPRSQSIERQGNQQVISRIKSSNSTILNTTDNTYNNEDMTKPESNNIRNNSYKETQYSDIKKLNNDNNKNKSDLTDRPEWSNCPYKKAAPDAEQIKVNSSSINRSTTTSKNSTVGYNAKSKDTTVSTPIVQAGSTNTKARSNQRSRKNSYSSTTNHTTNNTSVLTCDDINLAQSTTNLQNISNNRKNSRLVMDRVIEDAFSEEFTRLKESTKTSEKKRNDSSTTLSQGEDSLKSREARKKLEDALALEAAEKRAALKAAQDMQAELKLQKQREAENFKMMEDLKNRVLLLEAERSSTKTTDLLPNTQYSPEKLIIPNEPVVVENTTKSQKYDDDLLQATQELHHLNHLNVDDQFEAGCNGEVVSSYSHNCNNEEVQNFKSSNDRHLKQTLAESKLNSDARHHDDSESPVSRMYQMAPGEDEETYGVVDDTTIMKEFYYDTNLDLHEDTFSNNYGEHFKGHHHGNSNNDDEDDGVLNETDCIINEGSSDILNCDGGNNIEPQNSPLPAHFFNKDNHTILENEFHSDPNITSFEERKYNLVAALKKHRSASSSSIGHRSANEKILVDNVLELVESQRPKGSNCSDLVSGLVHSNMKFEDNVDALRKCMRIFVHCVYHVESESIRSSIFERVIKIVEDYKIAEDELIDQQALLVFANGMKSGGKVRLALFSKAVVLDLINYDVVRLAVDVIKKPCREACLFLIEGSSRGHEFANICVRLGAITKILNHVPKALEAEKLMAIDCITRHLTEDERAKLLKTMMR